MKKRLPLYAMLLLISPLVFLTQAAEPPRIILFVSIDQMRADHLERYSKEYSAGFKRLLSEGTFYANAELNYAVTSTGPGHATLATGVYPWKSGIVSNRWKDRNTHRPVYCVEDSIAMPVDGEGGGMSPKNLMVTAVGDWLQEASPLSRVVSISYKDRAAILMGGKKPTYAFWYDRAKGHMVTSSYYAPAVPEWAKMFNASRWIERNTPAAWTKLRADSVYSAYGPDELAGETPWKGKTVFPHVFEPNKIRGQLFNSPFGNSLLLDFARAALHGEELGKRGVTDLLCISLSPTDNIGSSFGPNSHEMIDNLLRLDLVLGSFLADLVSEFGRERVLVVLAGDHGVMPLPEYITNVEHRPARRFDNSAETSQKLKELDTLLRGETKTTDRIVNDGVINYAVAGKAGIHDRTLEQRLREGLLGVDGVADVYFRRELRDTTTPQRPYLDAYRHSYQLDRSPDFFIRNCEYCLITKDTTGTSHGSPYSYDSRVPILFWGPVLSMHRVNRPVHTVDIAATLAKLLNIEAPKNLDGVPLKEIVP